MVCQKGKEKADLSGENCCIVFVLVYLVICLFIMVKVAYWGENWGKNGVSLPRSLCQPCHKAPPFYECGIGQQVAPPPISLSS